VAAVPELKPEQLLLVAGFILPGAISMYVYGLKIPQRDFQLKDRIAEAVCFSLLNFVLVWLPVESVLETGTARQHPVASWVALTAGFVIAPLMWPLVLVRVLQEAEGRGWIAVRAKTAWDHFFGRQRTECWVQIELTDGRVVGGRYGADSFASSWPDPGHLYVQEVWRVDDEGYFVDPVPGNPGLLLRPTDYKLVRVFEGGSADA
jgi:hypothetical protein